LIARLICPKLEELLDNKVLKRVVQSSQFYYVRIASVSQLVVSHL